MFKYLNPIENVSIKIYKKVFESLVKPILMYNSADIYISGLFLIYTHLNTSQTCYMEYFFVERL
jgi:hypothetical protein